MNKKATMRSFVGLTGILLVIMISPQQASERIAKGRYFLQRAATPQFLVAGVNSDALTKAHFPTMSKVTEESAADFGTTRTLFDRKSKKQIAVTIAVYGSVKDAEDAALEMLNSISAFFTPGSASGGKIGENSWYLKSENGSGTVIFIEKNSLFQLFSSDYALTETTARSIVNDANKGLNGVRLGQTVRVPVINDVITEGNLQKDENSLFTIKATDPSGQSCQLAVSTLKGQSRGTGEWGKKLFCSLESGENELKAVAVNDENVVSKVFVKKITVSDKK